MQAVTASPLALLKLYGLMAVAFFAVDLIWLGVIAPAFYQDKLGHLLRDAPLWPAALAFYALYILGIMVFAVLPSVEAGSLPRVIALGAFLGLFAYATFDLTSYALLRDFPLVVVVVDLAWGTFITASVATCGFVFANWLGLA